MRRGARGLKQIIPQVDLIATSPLVRARQTAEILGHIYDNTVAIEIAELEPGASLESMLRWLQNQRSDATIMLVGHEPFLSMLISWLTTRSDDTFLEFKKGGACFITFDEGIYAGGATMQWLVTPAQLRSLSA
jgi:phosphohistidine phosphatase